MTYQLILFLVIVYFISSIPFGLVLSKFFGKKDIRKHGSKNIGATNVTRVLGKKLGLLTLILDSAKGAIMVILAQKLFCSLEWINTFKCLVGFIAVFGHIFPIYLKFKGGKGVATSIAVITAIDPIMGSVSIIVWISVFLVSRISAASSLLSLLFTTLFSIYDGANLENIIFYVTLLLLVTFRHKENLNRIMNGKENQF